MELLSSDSVDDGVLERFYLQRGGFPEAFVPTH